MGRKKQIKINEVETFPNVFRIENDAREEDLINYFGNANPITLEIGCGHGDYSVNLARLYPERNFIGLDVKPNRIHRGSKTALEEKISNLAFLVGRAEKLAEVFSSHCIESIWVPFPDPHVRRRSAFKRLISPYFLTIYKSILSQSGTINFKTDNEGLFEYAKEVLEVEKVVIHSLSENLYEAEPELHTHRIQTTYEKRYIEEGRIIKFVSFSFKI